MSDEEREKTIQKHYEGRAKKYTRGLSSEDVWNMREDRLENAFEGDLEALEEEERRRKRGQVEGEAGETKLRWSVGKGSTPT